MVKSRLVFVVDDDDSARRGITRLLRTAGHDVRSFSSANEFLDAFDPEIFGCMVLDARMPGMSGEELQAELKTRGVRLPIIVVSADDDPRTRRSAHRMNAAAFFRKPVDGAALLDAIDWAFRWNLANGHAEEIGNDESSEKKLKNLFESHREHKP
jgi:FixJ family two-component response regulator